MNRSITGYHQDREGDWVAELDCGHNQHVRHRPPFQERPWILTDQEREDRLGSPLACPLCDRAELPEVLRMIRSSTEWNERTLPAGLRRAHRLAAGTWGLIVVREGALRFSMESSPPLASELTRHTAQPIPPEIDHSVLPVGLVRFHIDFFTVDRSSQA